MIIVAGDLGLKTLLGLAGLSSLILVIGLAVLVVTKSLPAWEEYGWELFLGTRWSPSETGESRYGLLPAFLGTLVVAVVALVLALPSALALALAVYIVLPPRLSGLLRESVVIMAGLPTIVYGLWGSSFLAPFLKDWGFPLTTSLFGWVPLFQCEPLTGRSLLTAGILLAIMVTPFTFALILNAFERIPAVMREALWSLGLTRLEYSVELARLTLPSLLAAGLIAFGRAASETVAVALVVGNSYAMPTCLLQPGTTISALIANQFPESSLYPLMENALYAGGLLLLLLGVLTSLLGAVLMRRGEQVA